MLTGLTDTDTIVLKNLDNVSLYYACQIDKHTYKLCQEDDILHRRLMYYDKLYNRAHELTDKMSDSLSKIDINKVIKIDMPKYRQLIELQPGLFPKSMVDILTSKNTVKLLCYGVNDGLYIGYDIIYHGHRMERITYELFQDEIDEIFAAYMYYFPYDDIDWYVKV